MASMFLAKSVQRKQGKTYKYWHLRRTVWDKDEKRSRQEYLATVGSKQTISETEAERIAAQASERIGSTVTIDDLRKVKRLKIVPNGKQDTS